VTSERASDWSCDRSRIHTRLKSVRKGDQTEVADYTADTEAVTENVGTRDEIFGGGSVVDCKLGGRSDGARVRLYSR